MRHIFKAQDASHVEKAEIHPAAPIPEGWHDSRYAALAAWVEPEEPKKPGRPRKDAE